MRFFDKKTAENFGRIQQIYTFAARTNQTQTSAMRKTVFLLITLVVAISADAQLKVKASGLTEASCIDIEQNGPYTIMPYGIYSSQNNMAANENIGIVSSLNAYTGDSGYVNRRAIGILGHAESAYKYNFGVYGCEQRLWSDYQEWGEVEKGAQLIIQ